MRSSYERWLHLNRLDAWLPRQSKWKLALVAIVISLLVWLLIALLAWLLAHQNILPARRFRLYNASMAAGGH